jgi:Flp pilus assembly protein protease CpaA
MGGTAVACKNGVCPSIFAVGWHGGGDVLMGQYILAYGWHDGRVQERHKSIHFGVCGGMEVVML